MAIAERIVVRNSDISGESGAETLNVKTLTFRVPGFTLDVTDAEREDITERIAELEAAVRDLVRDTLGDVLDVYAALTAAGANTSGGAAAKASGNLDVVRRWARKQGHDVKDRGRIAAPILAAYQAAHPERVTNLDDDDTAVSGIGWDATAEDEPTAEDLAAIDAE